MAIQICNYTRNLLISLTIIIINVFLTKMVYCTLYSGIDPKNYKIFGDLPVKNDLNKYLQSLERIVNFSMRYKHHVEMNLEFGLFLINVHLKPVLRNKREKIPEPTYRRLGKLLFENDKVILYFHHMINNMPPDEQILKHDFIKMTTLYSNETFWSKRLPKLSLDLMKYTKRRTRTELSSIYSDPNIYQRNVFNFKKGIPSPHLSDKCMAVLAGNGVYDGLRGRLRCELPEICRKMLNEITGMGYFICHRLLLILLAHIGRGCVVASDQEDAAAMQRMCTLINDEAYYIAMNNYFIKDLLLEQVALCTLSGHAQFLQRTWISKALYFQTNVGCFSQNSPNRKNPLVEKTMRWAVKKDNNIFGGYCNTHFTGVAAGTLAAALRYILENYY